MKHEIFIKGQKGKLLTKKLINLWSVILIGGVSTNFQFQKMPKKL